MITSPVDIFLITVIILMFALRFLGKKGTIPEDIAIISSNAVGFFGTALYLLAGYFIDKNPLRLLLAFVTLAIGGIYLWYRMDAFRSSERDSENPMIDEEGDDHD